MRRLILGLALASLGLLGIPVPIHAQSYGPYGHGHYDYGHHGNYYQGHHEFFDDPYYLPPHAFTQAPAYYGPVPFCPYGGYVEYVPIRPFVVVLPGQPLYPGAGNFGGPEVKPGPIAPPADPIPPAKQLPPAQPQKVVLPPAGQVPPVLTKPLPYGGQKTCPVTGEELGSHGSAIPVTVQGQTIYVCCQGCVETVQENPATYLQKAQKEIASQ